MQIKRKKKMVWFSVLFALGILASSSFTDAAAPSRVVSLNLCTDELFLRLADPSQVAGVTRYVKTAEAEIKQQQAGAAVTLRGDVEDVVKLKPDLVIAGAFSRKETIDFLKKMKIPVLMVPVPASFEDIYANILLVARALDRLEAGEELVASMKKQMAEIETVSGRPRALLYQANGYAPGTGTFEHDILEKAGYRNLAAELGIQGHQKISLEKIMHHKPDLFVFISDHYERNSVGQDLLFHPALRQGLSATPSVVVPTEWVTCGNPESVQAVKLLAEKGSL